MRMNKTGALFSFIVLLNMLMVPAIPADTAKDHAFNGLLTPILYAQETSKPDQTAPREKEKPSDQSITLYQVMGVVLFIWIGLALFLFRLDRKVAKLENNVNNLK